METAHKAVPSLVYCLLVMLLMMVSAVQADARPYLLGWGWGGHNQPDYLAKNIKWMEASRPYDGIVVDSQVCWEIMQNKSIPYARFTKEFAPIKRGTFKRYQHNMLMVWFGGGKVESKPPDVFDDWSVIISNMKNAARLARAKGFDGIFLDNEEYSYTYWQYPRDIRYKDKSLEEYHMQARLRGRQTMEAMKSVYPRIQVIVLHGPGESCPDAMWKIRMWASRNNLIGSFAAGVIEGGDKYARGIDGGELYELTTGDQFKTAYQFQKYGIADPGVECLFMDDKLRAEWSKKCHVAYSVYDKVPSKPDWHWNWQLWKEIQDLDILYERVRNSLMHTDQYVWFFMESYDCFVRPEDYEPGPYKPRPIPESWISVISRAKTDANRQLDQDR